MKRGRKHGKSRDTTDLAPYHHIMPCADCSPTFTALKKFKQCQLWYKVRTNQYPFASEHTELTEIVSHAEKEISKYSDRIAQLHEQIVALENEQKKLKQQIHLAKSLMTPVRQFPPEVLRQIFLQNRTNVINLHHGPHIPGCVIPGMKLAAVCSHWRSIARATTELWNIIDITFGPDDESMDSLIAGRLVANILRLSGKSHLDITINLPHQSVWDLLVVQTLCRHADRWQSLRGCCDDPQASFFTYLRHLEGRVNQLHTFTFSAGEVLRMLRHAPKLHTLALSNYRSEEPLFPCEQLRHLTIDKSSLGDILQVVKQAANLETLELFGDFGDMWWDHEPVIHPKITSLHIIMLCQIEAGEDSLSAPLAYLTLPKLSSLCLEFDGWDNQGGYITDWITRWSYDLLPTFISHSPALTSLRLLRIWMPINHLISLLQSIPTLTTFELEEHDGLHGDPVGSMITNDLLEVLNCHQIRQPILTGLTSLSLGMCLPTSFSFTLFCEVIRSRWNPSSSSESPLVKDDESDIACIKTVKLKILYDTISWSLVQPLMILRKRGLDISVEDVGGLLGLVEDE